VISRVYKTVEATIDTCAVLSITCWAAVLFRHSCVCMYYLKSYTLRWKLLYPKHCI